MVLAATHFGIGTVRLMILSCTLRSIDSALSNGADTGDTHHKGTTLLAVLPTTSSPIIATVSAAHGEVALSRREDKVAVLLQLSSDRTVVMPGSDADA